MHFASSTACVATVYENGHVALSYAADGQAKLDHHCNRHRDQGLVGAGGQDERRFRGHEGAATRDHEQDAAHGAEDGRRLARVVAVLRGGHCAVCVCLVTVRLADGLGGRSKAPGRVHAVGCESAVGG